MNQIPSNAVATRAWQRALRALAMLLVPATLALWVYTSLRISELAVAEGRPPLDPGILWFMLLPLCACAALLWWTRVPWPAFVLTTAIVAFKLHSLVSSLRDPGTSGSVWLYESAFMDAVILWPAVFLAGVAAVIEAVVSRRRRAPVPVSSE